MIPGRPSDRLAFADSHKPGAQGGDDGGRKGAQGGDDSFI
jgi:hypothetical protein